MSKPVQLEIPAHVYAQWIREQQPNAITKTRRNNRKNSRRQKHNRNNQQYKKACKNTLWGKCCDATHNIFQSILYVIFALFFMFLGEMFQPFTNIPILNQLSVAIFGTSA